MLQSLDCFNQRPQIFRLPGGLEQAVSRAWLTTKTALGDVIVSTTWSLNSLMGKVAYQVRNQVLELVVEWYATKSTLRVRAKAG